MITLVACDKTIPGAAMALLRLNVPGLLLYGGSIAPGRFEGKDVTIQDVFEAVGAHNAGTMSAADVHELESVACPGAGAWPGCRTSTRRGARAGHVNRVVVMVDLTPYNARLRVRPMPAQTIPAFFQGGSLRETFPTCVVRCPPLCLRRGHDRQRVGRVRIVRRELRHR